MLTIRDVIFLSAVGGYFVCYCRVIFAFVTFTFA